nr:hypothetical protein [Tanacetum cinerariifolium]
LDSLKNWNDHFLWVDDFACPARFSWHTAENVTRDPTPIETDFYAQDYASLVAHRSPFQKFLEEFLCLVGLSHHYTLDEKTYPLFLDRDGEDMDIFAFIHTSDPTKVKVVERKRKDDEPRLLETTIGRTIPLLQVAPDRGQSINIQLVTETTDTIFKDVIPLMPRRQKKMKTTAVEVGGSLHPPRNLKEDQETPSGPPIAGKSRFAVQSLLVGAVLNAEVRGDPIPTFPFVTSSVSDTSEREGGGHTDSVTGPNLRTISALQRFVISLDSSHHSGANVAEAEADSLVRSFVTVMTSVTTTTPTVDHVVIVKVKNVKPFMFAADSSFAGGADPNAGVFFYLTGSDFIVSGIQCSVTNGSLLGDGRVCREIVDEFAPPMFFGSIRGMKHDQLFTEFNVGDARQMSLSAEVRMCAEYNIRGRMRLESVVKEKNQLLKAKDEEIKNLKAQMLLKEAKAAEAICLRVEASNFKAMEKSLRDEFNSLNKHNIILEKERNALDVKVMDLEAVVVSKERELTDSNAHLTSIKSQNDNLADQLEEFQDTQLKVVNDKFDKLYTDFVETTLHLEERYANGLAAGITHGKEGRVLTDVAAYNPFVEIDYVSALQQLQDVNFPLLAELKYYKDASVEALMNILHLEEHLAERLCLNESQPHADQLMENIKSHRSSLHGVFVPLAEPFSTAALTGMEDTSDTAPALLLPRTILLIWGLAFLYLLFGLHRGCASRIAASSLLSSKRSRLISKSLLFCTRSTSAVLSVGMPISARMIASVSYVNENGVSSLLDLIIVRCAHST